LFGFQRRDLLRPSGDKGVGDGGQEGSAI
jgi:hypothetical protein